MYKSVMMASETNRIWHVTIFRLAYHRACPPCKAVVWNLLSSVQHSLHINTSQHHVNTRIGSYLKWIGNEEKGKMCLVRELSTPGRNTISNHLGTLKWPLLQMTTMLYKPAKHLLVEHFLLTSLGPQAWEISTLACVVWTGRQALHTYIDVRIHWTKMYHIITMAYLYCDLLLGSFFGQHILQHWYRWHVVWTENYFSFPAKHTNDEK